MVAPSELHVQMYPSNRRWHIKMLALKLYPSYAVKLLCFNYYSGAVVHMQHCNIHLSAMPFQLLRHTDHSLSYTVVVMSLLYV